MIKRLSIALFLLGTASFQITQVQAAVISFDLSNQFVELGDSVTVDLRISELNNEILTTFDLDIGFEGSILNFQNFTFGTGLDVLEFGTFNNTDTIGSNAVNIYELSFDSDTDLISLQPNEFTLGTFNFETLSIGTSALNISTSALLGGESASFLIADLQYGSITVTAPPSAVPAPSTIWLFGIGLIGLMGYSKRKQDVF